MMKKFVLVLLMLCSCASWAGTLSPVLAADAVKLSFDRISVVTLIDTVFGDVLQENFVLHPSLVNSDMLVSLHFQAGMDKKGIRAFMLSFLNTAGIAVQDRNGYVFLVPIAAKDKEIDETEMFFYRPKFRPVSYITDLTSSVFAHGKFSSQRTVRSSPIGASAKASSAGGIVANNSSGASGNSASSGAGSVDVVSGAQSKAVDNGSSALSLQDKGEMDAFIFTGTVKEISMLQKLLVQIDVPVGEVLVKGVVYEVTTTSSEGSAFSLAAAILGQRFGVNIGQTLTGADSVSITTSNFNAVIGALNSDNRFKSINNASVRVKSGATGVLSVGSDVPVLGSVTVAAGGVSQQSVTYQPSGVIFNLSPVVRDGSIDLTIDEQISSFANTTTGVNGSPTLTKREMSTVVGANNDDVIVLGGLDQDNGNKGSAGAGFLPTFLRSVTSDSTKTEVLLVLNVHKI
jgi:general secretion pathway protein D